jgi:GT2 family glycosyltransferase
MASDLCVVVINWRQEVQTLRCISSIRQWRTLKPILVVVDNQSTSESEQTLNSALNPDELICSEANVGYAGGNNLGIAHASHRDASFILLLNSDAAIAETDVDRLLGRLRRDPAIAVLGPVLIEHRHGITTRYAGGRDILQHASTRQTLGVNDATNRAACPLIDVEYVPGAVFMSRRSLFEEIGALDEQFFFSGEIADLCRRARERGQRVCVDLSLEARHNIEDGPRGLRDTLYVYYSLRNRLLYAKKHENARRTRFFVLWLRLCLTELAKALARMRLRKARAILLAIAHGSVGRFGNQNDYFL